MTSTITKNNKAAGSATMDRISQNHSLESSLTAAKPRLWRTVVIAALSVTALSGCINMDYKRITYDFLRQEDCRRNDVYEFCSRTFVFEYDEYEQLRQEYMRSEQDKILRDQATRERYRSIYAGD